MRFEFISRFRRFSAHHSEHQPFFTHRGAIRQSIAVKVNEVDVGCGIMSGQAAISGGPVRRSHWPPGLPGFKTGRLHLIVKSRRRQGRNVVCTELCNAGQQRTSGRRRVGIAQRIAAHRVPADSDLNLRQTLVLSDPIAGLKGKGTIISVFQLKLHRVRGWESRHVHVRIVSDRGDV